MTTPATVARQRLACQQLARPTAATPQEVVARLGAVQAQDYAGALWAVGQRMRRGATEADVERAVDEGAIVRTHVLRPTWHLVAPGDLRWMLALTAPRVIAGSAYRYRQLELDDATIERSNAAVARALHGGRQLTRTELAEALSRAGIEGAAGERLNHLVMRAELDGVVCSGARRGRQFTYALLEERVPPVPALGPEEALAELARRYVTARGPATPHDLAWWSGLTVGDARRGLALAGPAVVQETIAGREHWRPASLAPDGGRGAHRAWLLPNYDEYFIGFRDRGAVLERAPGHTLGVRGDALAAHVVVVDGQVVGGWTRTLTSRGVVVAVTPVTRLAPAERAAVAAAADRYGAFLGRPVELLWRSE